MTEIMMKAKVRVTWLVKETREKGMFLGLGEKEGVTCTDGGHACYVNWEEGEGVEGRHGMTGGWKVNGVLCCFLWNITVPKLISQQQ